MTAKFETVTTHGAVVDIPLNRLKKSPKNARKVPHTEADVEARAASIGAKGMIQPPVVEPEVDGEGQPTGYYFVTAGESRRLALCLRAKRKEIRKTEPVRCLINTDRRTYHLELRATDGAYMASVSWRYPPPPVSADTFAATDPLAALNGATLNFGYRLKGRAPWKPVRVFDDGRQVFIEFPADVAQGELPPLFVTGSAGGEIVNYRVRGRHMIVDRLFSSAELRLAGKGKERRVRIERDERVG